MLSPSGAMLAAGGNLFGVASLTPNESHGGAGKVCGG